MVCDSSLVPHLLQHWDYPHVSLGNSILSVLAAGWPLLGRDRGTALGGSSDAELVGLKWILETPALLHPVLTPSWRLVWEVWAEGVRLRFGRGNEAVKSCGFNVVREMCI